jgi:hypothetical protein
LRYTTRDDVIVLSHKGYKRKGTFVATTIKVDRVILTDALKAKYAEQEKLRADYKKAEEKYKKAQEAFASKVITLAKSGKLEVHNTNYRSWNSILEIEFRVDREQLPTEPENPKYPDGYMGDHDFEELGRTIKLLAMTNEPSVPASVYKSVSQWL